MLHTAAAAPARAPAVPAAVVVIRTSGRGAEEWGPPTDPELTARGVRAEAPDAGAKADAAAAETAAAAAAARPDAAAALLPRPPPTSAASVPSSPSSPSSSEEEALPLPPPELPPAAAAVSSSSSSCGDASTPGLVRLRARGRPAWPALAAVLRAVRRCTPPPPPPPPPLPPPRLYPAERRRSCSRPCPCPCCRAPSASAETSQPRMAPAPEPVKSTGREGWKQSERTRPAAAAAGKGDSYATSADAASVSHSPSVPGQAARCCRSHTPAAALRALAVDGRLTPPPPLPSRDPAAATGGAEARKRRTEPSSHPSATSTPALGSCCIKPAPPPLLPSPAAAAAKGSGDPSSSPAAEAEEDASCCCRCRDARRRGTARAKGQAPMHHAAPPAESTRWWSSRADQSASRIAPFKVQTSKRQPSTPPSLAAAAARDPAPAAGVAPRFTGDSTSTQTMLRIAARGLPGTAQRSSQGCRAWPRSTDTAVSNGAEPFALPASNPCLSHAQSSRSAFSRATAMYCPDGCWASATMPLGL
jgi:trimeric autotransporter adhesin